MMGTLEKLIVVSGRWKKWINEDESADDFYAISPERRRWLLGTGARYVWQNPEAVAARISLYDNLNQNGIDAEEIVLSNIEKDIDKYFHAFNIVNLNNYL